jgi:hypothetical protein
VEATVRVLADNAHVKTVRWCNSRWLFGREKLPVAVPTYVWKALAKLSGSLEELHMGGSYTHIDMDWVSFLLLISTIRSLIAPWHTSSQHAICASEYPHLRTLYVDFGSTDRCSPLQVLLNGLSQLEDLYIRAPKEKAPSGLDLSSYHPRLRTFKFVGECPPASFLSRHPTIELLSIKVKHGFIPGDCHLPQLKALIVDGMMMENAPGRLSSSARHPIGPITHLRLFDGYDPIRPHIPAIHHLIGNVRDTLRHLELTWFLEESIEEWFPPFQLLPHLEELRIRAYERAYEPPGRMSLSKDDIASFFYQASVL